MKNPTLIEPICFISAYRELLTSLPLFAGIDFGTLELFLNRCEYKSLRRQELLLSPSVDNHYLYVLLSGQLSAHVNENEYEKGFRIMPGEFVGEVSIVDNQPPTAYVTAFQDSLLLCIPETVLWSEFILLPDAARNILRQIIKRVRARNAAIQKSIEQALRLELLDKELRIAQDLQASMLPRQPLFPGIERVEAAALMKAAKEVGGDLYDAFALDAEHICLAIGDVAGKGIPAALFMMRTITMLRAEMIKTKDLLQTIHAVNTLLSQDNPQCMFVTLMICVLNLNNGELQYVNGGHNRPILGNFDKGFQYQDQPSGILVGINTDANYQLASRNLKPGDVFILYTDGITEANNPAQEELSEHRFLQLINQLQEQHAESVVETIKDAVVDFAAGAEQSDDITLLVLRYL